MTMLRGKTTFWLCVRFIVLAPICLVLWLLALPYYAQVLGYSTAAIVRYVTKVPLEFVAITHNGNGVLNTDIALSYRYPDHAPAMPDVGHLVTNVAPFVALILATGGLGLWRRLRILCAGVLILFAFHVLTIVLQFRELLNAAERTPWPDAVGFATITLPFLLWIVLAYWDKLTAYFAVEEEPATTPAETISGDKNASQ